MLICLKKIKKHSTIYGINLPTKWFIYQYCNRENKILGSIQPSILSVIADR